MPNTPKILMTYAFLENAEGGTHIKIRIAKLESKDFPFLEHVCEVFQKDITNEVAKLREMIEGKTESPAIVTEPSLSAILLGLAGLNSYTSINTQAGYTSSLP